MPETWPVGLDLASQKLSLNMRHVMSTCIATHSYGWTASAPLSVMQRDE